MLFLWADIWWSIMSFDLILHISNHAWSVKIDENINVDECLHFNFSFEDLQFLNLSDDEVGQKMLYIIEKIKEPAEFSEKNGKNADGSPRYRRRKFEISNDIKAEAVHLQGIRGEKTHPHVHLLIKKNARMGKDFGYLRKRISEISQEIGLTVNWDQVTKYNPQSVKNLQRAVKKFTWTIQQKDNDGFRSLVLKNADIFAKQISLLEELTKKTGNYSYFAKTMRHIQHRLNAQRLDFTYNNTNLRYKIEPLLTPEIMGCIQSIQRGEFTQKKLQYHLDNPIMKDYIRFSAGLNAPYWAILKENTNLLDGVRKNKKAVENYSKLKQKTKNKQKAKSEYTPHDFERLRVLKNIKSDIHFAIQKSKNEKELKENLGGASLKKRSGKVIGIKIGENVVKMTEIGIPWSEVLHKMKMNASAENETTKTTTTTKEKKHEYYIDCKIRRIDEKIQQNSERIQTAGGIYQKFRNAADRLYEAARKTYNGFSERAARIVEGVAKKRLDEISDLRAKQSDSDKSITEVKENAIEAKFDLADEAIIDEIDIMFNQDVKRKRKRGSRL